MGSVEVEEVTEQAWDGGLRALRAAIGRRISGIGVSMVLRLRRVESRRIPCLMTPYDELLDETELIEEVTELTEAVVIDDDVVGSCRSLELSDAGIVNWEVCGGRR